MRTDPEDSLDPCTSGQSIGISRWSPRVGVPGPPNVFAESACACKRPRMCRCVRLVFADGTDQTRLRLGNAYMKQTRVSPAGPAQWAHRSFASTRVKTLICMDTDLSVYSSQADDLPYTGSAFAKPCCMRQLELEQSLTPAKSHSPPENIEGPLEV
jgi:hypothetical protein